MNAVVKTEVVQLPEPVARRGISEAAWRTLMNNLYPGAKAESVLMVWDYCVARKLDPLKKPCHIVPMNVGSEWRDVVMPGIYEYRTTATRTGEYMGHSKPEYGEQIEYLKVKAPEYCDITVYRWNKLAHMKAEFPVRVKFVEIVATAKDKKTGDPYVNARWTKAPEQMLTKCTEAAGLREAFPDELGGTHTEEEMVGKVIDVSPKTTIGNSRFGMTETETEEVQKHFSAIVDILNADRDEYDIADMLRDYDQTYFGTTAPELGLAVTDKLKRDGIITKGKYREYLEKRRPENEDARIP
jgi:phage recombination protein Bet